MKAYSIEFIDKVLSYRVNNPTKETCLHFRIAHNTLKGWIQKYGREYGLTNRKIARDLHDDIQMMRALRNDGMTLREIASKFEMGVDFVHRNTTKPTDLMSASAFVDAVKSGNMPAEKTRITMKNKIVGTFVPE